MFKNTFRNICICHCLYDRSSKIFIKSFLDCGNVNDEALECHDFRIKPSGPHCSLSTQ